MFFAIVELLQDGETPQDIDKPVPISEEAFEESSRIRSTSVRSQMGDECWIIYEGKVYEVTSLLGSLREVDEQACGTQIENLSEKSQVLISPYFVANVE